MFILKVYRKLYHEIKKTLYRVLYGDSLEMGENLTFRKGLTLEIVGEGKLKIGQNCFFNQYCSINCLGEILIGNDCLFGENVKLYDHNHNYKNKNIKIIDQGFNIGKIKIGNNCWIGSNVTILKDVIIGDNVIIGANCLIYKSIPSNSIVKCDSNVTIEQNKVNTDINK